jgi:glycosyltransferase involved in cell wall biosynthesis
MPTISCIIPVYNQAEYLGEALDSVLRQTVAPTEVIVVDDGSTDAIDMALRPYRDQVRVLQQANRGPAVARNAGIRIATGEWLSFLDGDDVWDPTKLERQLAAFAMDPRLDYCLTFVRHFWQPESADRERELRALNHAITRDGPGFTFQTLLVRAATFARVGALDEALRIGEDTDWFARARAMGLRRRIMDAVLVHRRMHERNLSYGCETAEGLADRKRLLFAHIARTRGHAT